MMTDGSSGTEATHFKSVKDMFHSSYQLNNRATKMLKKFDTPLETKTDL